MKKWLRWISQSRKVEDKFKKDYFFLVEIANSSFNLITDADVKKKISEHVSGMAEETIPELFFKSYLYLMIGNITRSDNLLKKIISKPPRFIWRRKNKETIEHRIGKEFVRQIFLKFSRHPADRKIFHLVVLYLQSYFNEQSLLELSAEVDTKELKSKMSLKAVEILAPQFVNFLRISSMNQEQRMTELSIDRFPIKQQAYWLWPFLTIGQLPSTDVINICKEIEKEDMLWYIYTISEETISEIFARQSSNTFLPKYRGILTLMLNDSEYFMMALYKLIELGDINSEMLKKTIQQMTYD